MGTSNIDISDLYQVVITLKTAILTKIDRISLSPWLQQEREKERETNINFLRAIGNDASSLSAVNPSSPVTLYILSHNHYISL